VLQAQCQKPNTQDKYWLIPLYKKNCSKQMIQQNISAVDIVIKMRHFCCIPTAIPSTEQKI
jgi:hypothetical protein